jgi:hypothetical protein
MLPDAAEEVPLLIGPQVVHGEDREDRVVASLDRGLDDIALAQLHSILVAGQPLRGA